jgi:hypothetical protein
VFVRILSGFNFAEILRYSKNQSNPKFEWHNRWH